MRHTIYDMTLVIKSEKSGLSSFPSNGVSIAIFYVFREGTKIQCSIINCASKWGGKAKVAIEGL